MSAVDSLQTHWQLVRGDGDQILAIPPTITFGSPARGPD
jgi:hypothetical protein